MKAHARMCIVAAARSQYILEEQAFLEEIHLTGAKQETKVHSAVPPARWQGVALGRFDIVFAGVADAVRSHRTAASNTIIEHLVSPPRTLMRG